MSFPRYPDYKDSGVEWLGEVPVHWGVQRFKLSVESCRNGVWGEEPAGDLNDLPCVRVADFDRSRLRVILDDPTMRNIKPSEKKGRVLNRGNLVLEKSGGGEKQPVGFVVLYDDEREAVCSNFIARIELSGGMHPSFWRYVHAAAYSIRLNVPSIKQTSGIQNLDQQSYFDERAAYPPSDEQAKIADFLDHETARIDALVEEQQRLIELLKEKRQAVISHAVTKGLDPDVPMKDSGVAWLGEVPAHWDVRKISYDFSAVKGPRGAVLTKEYCAEHSGPYPVYSGQTENSGILGHIDDFDFCLGDGGGLLTTTVGAKAMSINFVKGNISLSQNCMLIRPSAKSILVRFYVFHLQPLFALERRLIPDHMQPSFRMEDLYSFRVAVPPISEQETIARFLEFEMTKFDGLADEAANLIECLKERRSALISAAVTGKIDVRGWRPPAVSLTPTEATEAEAV